MSTLINPTQWTTVQNALKGQLGEDVFNSWIKPLRLDVQSTAAEAGAKQAVTLAVPTQFMQNWIDDNYGDAIQKSLGETLQKDIAVKYVIRPALADMLGAENIAGGIHHGATVGKSIPVENKFGTTITKTTAKTATKTTHTSNLQLDPRYTFESYVTGKSNDLAVAAAGRIAETEAPVYNPFFLHGGVGLGKTHLMHAIGHRMSLLFPEKKVLYLSAEQFLQRFIKAMRDKDTLSFKDTMRAVDVLMIDDIQFIAGKNSTQEEFFHTFNTLVAMGKQVILTADRSPHELENIEDRLRSRLGCGLTCEVHPPEVETRLAILQQKAEQLNLDLPHNVALLLANGIASNVRELEGALNRLAAHADLTGAELTMEFAQAQLRDLFRANTKTVTVDEIQKKVCDYCDVSLADLLGQRRMRPIARPRQLAMFLAKRLTSKSYPDIGKSFGGRDHTTVIHAVRTIENLLPRDKDLAEKADVLERVLTTR